MDSMRLPNQLGNAGARWVHIGCTQIVSSELLAAARIVFDSVDNYCSLQKLRTRITLVGSASTQSETWRPESCPLRFAFNGSSQSIYEQCFAKEPFSSTQSTGVKTVTNNPS